MVLMEEKSIRIRIYPYPQKSTMKLVSSIRIYDFDNRQRKSSSDSYFTAKLMYDNLTRY